MKWMLLGVASIVFVATTADAQTAATTSAPPIANTSPVANTESSNTAATAVLNTSPLYADSGQTYHACTVGNIAGSAVVVSAEILDLNGTVLLSYSNVTLASGTSKELAINETYSGFARCKVSVRGSASSIRANLAVFYFNNSGAYYQAIGFAEAR